MCILTAARFAEFFREVYGAGKEPFPWQKRIVARVCDGARGWPRAIALPTAAGKTACIDIAVFSLACQAGVSTSRTAPRRIFFTVDRRIIVDQAYDHAQALAAKIASARSGICHEVAEALRRLAEDDRPLDVYCLHGGMYRETAWVRSPLQPTIIATTVDQVGSRLLFRGYGVSDSMKPIHAGLVGNDALILLDEAHCAKPFEQTARYVEQYRTWGDDNTLTPFRFVSITATPSSDLPVDQIEGDEEEDRVHPVLGPRLAASKPARLVVAEKAKGKAWKNWGPSLVDVLANQARQLMGAELGVDKVGTKHVVQAVGVLVNRVATARELARKLREPAGKTKIHQPRADVILLTGRMRPIDRDGVVVPRLQPLCSGSKKPLAGPIFVVATQCIEVGADLDFHALVTECASLDALRQRFGRVNRVAARPATAAAVVVRADQMDDSESDPVYGASLSNTWSWLKSIASADTVDFGVAALREATEDLDIAPLNAPSPDAPVLFPVHLDYWVQTHPTPAPDPDPAVFLHGPTSSAADVQVVLRDDLGDDPRQWAEIVSLRPPSSSEALPVPIGLFRRWLAGEEAPDDSGDVEGEATSGELRATPGSRTVLRWGGPSRSYRVSQADAVRPGDTLVIRTNETGVETLGDFPEPSPSDCGDEAYQRSRDRAILRVGPLEVSGDDDDFEAALTEAIQAQCTDGSPPWRKRAVEDLAVPKRRRVFPHPLGGWVIVGKHRLHQYDATFLEDDESSESPTRREVTLDDHSRGVAAWARRFGAGCGLDANLYESAGMFHDLGKLDPRCQAMLKGRSPRTAGGVALAKSSSYGAGNRSVHRYPAGARHELLSAVLLATRATDDLLLHLVATHHGAARPFASAVEEDGEARSPFTAGFCGHTFSIASCAQMPEQWNFQLAERFWRMVRKYGWWGVAFREAVFRLADHACSRAEQEGQTHVMPITSLPSLPTSTDQRVSMHPIELTGLDGSNPLAFLAALGTLRVVDQAVDGNARLHWVHKGQWTPVLHVSAEVTPDTLVEKLHASIHRVPDAAALDKAKGFERQYQVKKKAAEEAMKAIRNRKLRGAERDVAVASEYAPLERIAEEARAMWLHALEAAVPAPFLSLGKSLAVSPEEFRTFALRSAEQLSESGLGGRSDADFAVAFGCEVCITDSGRVIPTEFQLITGSGHQFFLETLGTLMANATPDQFRRALFGPWKHEDPRLSFRWDPLDDRRYAYAWNDPSDEEVRTEHGANLLAAFGLPLFPVMPTTNGPVTTGFRRDADSLLWTWPLWHHPFAIDSVRSLLEASDLGILPVNRRGLAAIGVVQVFRVEKIEVGRPPLSKLNLTAAVPV
jgi:CRISPR-associated endonuclease/helicase Cas3